MADKTLSSIVANLETVTADLKDVHTKLHAFQQAVKDLQEFGQKFNEAVAHQDQAWLLKFQENLNSTIRHLSETATEFGKVLR